LCSAQALLTMVVPHSEYTSAINADPLTQTLYLLGTFHNNPSSTMVLLAIRMLSGIPPPQDGVSQQFQLVRMLVQALDIDHALPVGMPPTELGAVDYSTTPMLLDSYEDPTILFDCYPVFCRLLELKEEVYYQLYSVSAQSKSDYQVIEAVDQLDSQLEQWRSDIPERYRLDHPKARGAIEQGISDAVLQLHLSYYNYILVIHRRSILLGQYPNTSKSLYIAPRSSNPRALILTQLCAEAARTSLRLVKHILKDNPMTRGVMLHYAVFALKLLVILTVQDPSSPRARADILLMRNLEDVLSAICAGHEERSTQNPIEYCTRRRDIAEQAITMFSRGRGQNHMTNHGRAIVTSHHVP
ncbi:hypothetical protein BDV12DRAFT_180934, partial [Aspergillus spectabilis]